MLYLLVAALLCSSAAAKLSCNELFASYDLSRNFNETIAHTIHAMNVQGLRLFNPKATVDNRIPTVNMYSSLHDEEHLVLPYAPEDSHGEDFTTETMNIIDAILSRYGLDDEGLSPKWSMTEEIVHRFHLIDTWHRVKEVYQEVKENPPQDDLCDCLLDTKSNGIWQTVHRVAESYKAGVPCSNTKLDRALPKLTDDASWREWKLRRLFRFYKRAPMYDSSLFLYCATKHF